jgi:hypothetical protein
MTLHLTKRPRYAIMQANNQAVVPAVMESNGATCMQASNSCIVLPYAYQKEVDPVRGQELKQTLNVHPGTESMWHVRSSLKAVVLCQSLQIGQKRSLEDLQPLPAVVPVEVQAPGAPRRCLSCAPARRYLPGSGGRHAECAQDGHEQLV